jgi:nucleotide-binding universal stress UspA family protein
VNIKPMVVRLESALERNDLMEQMVLLPEPASAACKWANSTKSVNLVVGYNASPRSQTALDLTMWIAHQTRLATQKQVTVQVVYVVDEIQNNKCPDRFNLADVKRSSIHSLPSGFPKASTSTQSATCVLTKPKAQALVVERDRKSVKKGCPKTTSRQSDWFEQADHILWQARCLAQEWRGSFKAHLRIGDVATELRKVVESEEATLLFLGCNSVHHPIVEKLSSNFPCSVLGIPRDLS